MLKLKSFCAVGMIFFLTSCTAYRAKPAKASPPAPTPTVASEPPVAPPPPKPAEQPQIPPPEVSIQTQPPASVPPALEQAPQLPAPPKPPRRRRTKATQAQTTPPPQQPTIEPSKPPVAAQPEDEPTAPVQLVPLLSADAQRAYAQAVSELIAKAERNLAECRSRNPNQQQKVLMDQARRFIAQAKEVRKKDLPAAKSLAERAEIVSREALGQF